MATTRKIGEGTFKGTQYDFNIESENLDELYNVKTLQQIKNILQININYLIFLIFIIYTLKEGNI
jgi:hypothetical protein